MLISTNTLTIGNMALISCQSRSAGRPRMQLDGYLSMARNEMLNYCTSVCFTLFELSNQICSNKFFLSCSVIQRLSPYTSSLDGHDPPPAFTTQWMKFLVQSPLVVYLSILSAAYFQATARRINVEKSVDAVATRTRLIGLINEHISGCGSTGGISDEAIAAVMSLSYNEVSDIQKL